MKTPTFLGYRRKNKRVGIRNHVIILPVDDISNAACEAVANNVKGTMALPHAYGRLQFGEDLELFFRTMIGTGSNPNVAAVIVIGIEPGWTQRIVDGIAKTGKPVAGFSIERHGDLQTIADAARKAKERGMLGRRTLYLGQMRRVGYDHWPGLLPGGGQRDRQDRGDGRHRLLWRDD